MRYGESGNVATMTVRGRCLDRAPAACFDDTSLVLDAREVHLAASCSCGREQHYQYRWDELDRIVEARRYDRAGSGDWALQVRQRYRYDGGNVRTVKQTVDEFVAGNGVERVVLYVMPGDFDRRGLVTNPIAMTYDASTALGTETQYLVSGTRVVWKPGATGGTGFERDARITLPMSNLIQSTSAVVDLVSGELLEVGTYYPNGARETLRSNEEAERFALEPSGFTGKEGDDEVELIYFGERYLLQHLGRWASPDPLQVHQGGGGEFGNSYHYVAGNLLRGRDPSGLDDGELRLTTPREQLVELLRLRNLGQDPATGAFKAHEARTASRLEQILGTVLRRGSATDGDWVDPRNGRTYDPVGRDGPQGQFDVGRFARQLDIHLRTYDRAVVDYSEFHSLGNRGLVRQVVEALPDAAKARVIEIAPELAQGVSE